MEKAKREAAAQCRPAKSERENRVSLRNDRLYALKHNTFQTEKALESHPEPKPAWHCQKTASMAQGFPLPNTFLHRQIIPEVQHGADVLHQDKNIRRLRRNNRSRRLPQNIMADWRHTARRLFVPAARGAADPALFSASGTPSGQSEPGQRTGKATYKKRSAKTVGKTGKRQDDTEGTADKNTAHYQFFHGFPCREAP